MMSEDAYGRETARFQEDSHQKYLHKEINAERGNKVSARGTIV